VAAAKLKSQKSRKPEKIKPPALADLALLISMGAPLDTRMAALYLGLSAGTLAIYRSAGKGPRCEFAASRPRYTKSALDEWLTTGKPKATAVAP
jgi:hypothetical protein